MDSLEITKPPPAHSASIDGVVANPASGSCCAPAASTPAREGLLKSWIGDRRVLAVAGLAVTGTGLGLGWDWLTAVGVAPLIVSAAPCLLMCALGLCMMGRGRQASTSQPNALADEPTARMEPPASL
jgi:hypothetical protein